jgi:cytochrome c peroxidase
VKNRNRHTRLPWILCGLAVVASTVTLGAQGADTELLLENGSDIGREVSVPVHLRDGEEFGLPTERLIAYGKSLFEAVWTVQEGGGRPEAKGTGDPLADPLSPLIFPRNFNRLSAPDSNSCSGCHNQPFGLAGGSGDFVTNVFVLAQRFDFLNFDSRDTIRTRGDLDELGNPAELDRVANSRRTIGMFGSGFVEMLARQMTGDLQAIRAEITPGGSRQLQTKGISFGRLSRRPDGSWDTSQVVGLPVSSSASTGAAAPPSLLILPFHQSGQVVSLRQFTNNAFVQHFGIQSTERFGDGTDPDGDGVVNELTRADVTATVLFQATMPVPGRVRPSDPRVRAAAERGETLFGRIGCTSCHVPELPLQKNGWVFTEPSPYNPAGNLRPQDTRTLRVDLTDRNLPGPRLQATDGVVYVPAYTDMKLHDITSGPGDPNREPLDQNAPAGSAQFFKGNSRFLTRKLWGVGNSPPFFHHGKFTTLRQAIVAHAGEARAAATAFGALSSLDQGSIIEFLKTLQVLPPESRSHRDDDNR